MTIIRCAMVTLSVLVLTAADVMAQERIVVRGRVVEAGAGTPVVDAEVRAVCHDVSVTTAADGTWAMRLPGGAHEFVVEHLAYAEGRAHVHGSAAAPVTVQLTPRPVSLRELVITASRRLQELKDVAVATEVVSREEIERS